MAKDGNAMVQVGEFLLGLAISLLCLYVSIACFSFGPGARMMPLLISVPLGAISLFHALPIVYRLIRRRLPEERMESADVRLLEKMNVVPLVAATIALLYVFSIPPIGFEISSFLFLFLVMILIEPIFTMAKLLIAITAPTLLYLVFVYGLQLRLPLIVERILEQKGSF